MIDSLLTGDFETFRASFSQLILPAFTLGIFSLAPIARMTRASMLAVLASEFVRTARASGLNDRTVILTYAFRNAMLPVVTTLGMVFSFLLGANVLVEKVFAWPGIGSYAVEALLQSDFAPVQGFVLTMAVLYVALNLMIDMLYGVIDPRVDERNQPDHQPGARGFAQAAEQLDLPAHALCDGGQRGDGVVLRAVHDHRALRTDRALRRAV
jgi:peptide/nickel transport system permease protein